MLDNHSIFIINAVFTIFMAVLALIDFTSYRSKSHKDFKSVIMSVGILGTFFGIFWGLQDFDTRNIQNSVPYLLDGLKIAFFTSIVGMGLAILLSVLQKLYPTKTQEQQESEYVLNQMEKMDYLEHLDQMRGLDKLEMLTHLVLIEKHNKGMYNRLGEFLDEYKQGQQSMQMLIKEGLENTNHSLDKAITELARGASSEIIHALESVIKDFNTNLTEQFGDNFKQLNHSIDNMIAWQDNYKSSIETLEHNLTKSTELMGQTQSTLETVASRNQEIIRVHEQLDSMLGAHHAQLENINNHLRSYEHLGSKATSAFETMNKLFHTMREQLDHFSHHIGARFHALEEEVVRALSESVDQSIQANRNHSHEVLEHSRHVHEEMKNSVIGNLDGVGQHVQWQHEQLKENITQQLHEVSEGVSGVRQGILDQVNALGEHLKQTQSDVLEHTREHHESMKNAMINHIDGVSGHVNWQHENMKNQIDSQMQVLRDGINGVKEGVLHQVNDLSTHIREIQDQMLENARENHGKLSESFGSAVGNMQHELALLERIAMEKLEHLSENLLQVNRDYHQSLSEQVGGTVESTGNQLLELQKEMQNHSEITYKAMSETLDETKEGFAGTMTFMRDEFSKSAGQVVEGFDKTNQALRSVFTKLIRNINHSNQELKKLYAAQIEESGNLFMGMVQQSGEALGAVRKTMDMAMKDLVMDGGSLFKNLNVDMRENLGSMIKELDSQFLNAKMLMEENTTALAQNYVKFLEESIEETTKAPKNLTKDMEETFKKLQQELRAYALNTHTSIRDSKTDMEKVLITMHESLNSQIQDNQNLHQDLQKSLRALDGSLGDMTAQFKHDYDWFLKRIRELIGSRNF